MNTLKRNLFLIAILALPVLAGAQSGNILTQTRIWNSAYGIDLATSDTVAVQMKFTSYSTDRIEYKGPKGPAQLFDITSTQGTWANIAVPGRMTYNVSINNESGIIIIEKTSEGVFLTIDMSAASNGGIKMKYNISSIE